MLYYLLFSSRVVVQSVATTQQQESVTEELTAFIDLGHDVIALILDYVTRWRTDELAQYRSVCADFGNVLNLYAEQMSTNFKYRKLTLCPI